MATDNPAATEAKLAGPRKAFELRDQILNKLAQSKGICEVIRSNPDAEGSISDSLWAVDELLEDAKKAVDELYQQLTSTEKGVQS